MLDEALSTVFRTPMRLRAAGRTDAGVHATGQVAHVDVPPAALANAYPRSPQVGEAEFVPLIRRLARFLPTDVRVLDIARAPAGFDARFSALRRHYVYRLSTAPYGVEPLQARYITAWPRALDVDAMAAASRDLLGLHDFAGFCRHRENATTIRDLQRLDWSRDGDLITAHVTADAFCWSMVRSLVGALLAVGEHRRRCRGVVNCSPPQPVPATSRPLRRMGSPWWAWTTRPMTNWRRATWSPGICAPATELQLAGGEGGGLIHQAGVNVGRLQVR